MPFMPQRTSSFMADKLLFILHLGHSVGISEKCIKLRPIAVIKG